MMDAKRGQFVRMMDQSIGLLRQSAVAGSLAPQRALSDAMSDLIAEAERLRDDEDMWIFGRDREGRVVNKSGQIIGGNDE
jgi:hypothetical protein